MNLKIISAGAGSGKTYRLTQEMVHLLSQKDQHGQPTVRAAGIIATTFTKKAAAELQERVRVKLLEQGMVDASRDLANALIGTVHSLGVSLLKRFAFEAGVSPDVDIMAEEDQQTMFNQSLAMVLTLERVTRMEMLATELGQNKNRDYDWRQDVRLITEVARTNGIRPSELEKSARHSWETLLEFLGPDDPSLDADQLHRQLQEILEQTIHALTHNQDSTKATAGVVEELSQLKVELDRRGSLHWYNWVKIGKMQTKVGKKSRDDIQPLTNFTAEHQRCPDFQQSIRAFTELLFQTAAEAMDEFDRYKKQRGLIDYTDMEVLVNELLDQPSIREILRAELDLLMVDEFQDTSPLQLELFLKIARLAKQSIWVGDPKQSIYGFRGADPALMAAIIEAAGGIAPENIQEFSWRSREDLVHTVNAIFTKRFAGVPEEQVRLIAKRSKEKEPAAMREALLHWYAEPDPEVTRPPMSWFDGALAEMLRMELARGWTIFSKESQTYRRAKPGDVAILCRSNRKCESMAEALAHAGLRAALSRVGLLQTAEVKLVLACMKYILNKHDSLSVAEILVLGAGWKTEEMIAHRLDFLENLETDFQLPDWAGDADLINRLNQLRERVFELSSSEILQVLLEELDLRNLIVRWGKAHQRLDNIANLQKYAHQYEEACNRLQSAASLGGFLLWLGDLAQKSADEQASGAGEGAVNVMTYHKSKGLEFPITICHSLEDDLRAEAWGLSLESANQTVDLDHLLAGRWIRFWVNPYGDQVKNTPLNDAIEASKRKREIEERASQEEARLMYVGLTRARDYLVIPTRRGKATKWLNRIWHGIEDQPTLDPMVAESPWTWEGKGMRIGVVREVFGRDFAATPIEESEPAVLDIKKGKKRYEYLNIDVDMEKWSRNYRWSLLGPIMHKSDFKLELADGIPLAGKAVSAFLTADQSSYPMARRQEMARQILERFGADAVLESGALVRFSESFQQYFFKKYQVEKAHRNVPLRGGVGERIFETEVDVLYQAKEGWVVVRHEAGGLMEPDKQQKQVERYLDWSYLTGRVLKSMYGKAPVAIWIHFVLTGTLFAIGIEGGQEDRQPI